MIQERFYGEKYESYFRKEISKWHIQEKKSRNFDTAWAYAGSEDAIRQALVERYPREKFQLATKNAAWINCKTKEEATAQFETSLKQTGAGYFDFYLLHNLGEARTKYFDDFDMWNWVQEKKAEGLIKHAGFFSTLHQKNWKRS